MRCVVALFGAVLLAGQDAQFDVQSRLVLVPVTVTDGKGQTVDGLEPEDFVVLDNGQPQKAAVDSFATGVAPIALVIAVQSSGISMAALDKVRKIGGMIQPLITGHRGCAALMAFAESVNWLQECTADYDALEIAFQKLRPGEDRAAHMLDAAHEAIQRLSKRPRARRVLLLISESRDRGSETELESVAMAAQTAGVAVYAATYSAFKTAWTAKNSEKERKPGDPPPKPKLQRQPKGPKRPPREADTPTGSERPPLPPPEQRVDVPGAIGELARLGKTKDAEELTKATGGATFSFARQKGLEDAIEKLGEELHTQYVLSFTPEAPVAGYHRLEVRVVRDGEFKIRARPGYWTAGEAR